MDGEIIRLLADYLNRGFHKITYIGEIPELIESFNNLKGVPGFSALENLLNSLLSRPNPEEVWEYIEHTLAVAKVASEYKNRGYPVELEETLGRKDQKKPDFRILVDNQWTYFDVKTSSMFPGEKVFLDDVLPKLKKELPKISFPWGYCLILRFRESQARSEVLFLVKKMKRLRQKILSIPKDKVKNIYPLPSAYGAIVFWKNYSTQDFGELLAKCMDVVQCIKDVVQCINIPAIIDQIVRDGYSVIALDARIHKYHGEVFVTVEDQGMLIGRLSEEFEKTRLEIILNRALEKAPENAPYVVFVFSRRVILKELTPNIVYQVFKDPRINQISGLVLDIENTTSDREKHAHRRQVFRNPNAMIQIDESVLR